MASSPVFDERNLPAPDLERKKDEAYVFLRETRVDTHDSYASIAALRRKVDWRLMPLMSLAYTMTFVDKVLINVSTSTENSLSKKIPNDRISVRRGDGTF